MKPFKNWKHQKPAKLFPINICEHKTLNNIDTKSLLFFGHIFPFQFSNNHLDFLYFSILEYILQIKNYES